MIELVVLDVNETLFPLDPIRARMAEVGLAGATELWFAHVLRDGIAAAAAGRFAPFAELGRHHLHALLEGDASSDPTASADHVLAGFGEVEPHPDVGVGLQALRRAGIPAVTLTNGSDELTRGFLERGGLSELVAGVHDVQEAGRWKPAPDAYRHLLDRYEVPAERAAMIAVHPWDLLGAQAAGLTAAWLDRDGARYPAPFGSPDVRAPTLDGVVARLLELGSPPGLGSSPGRT